MSSLPADAPPLPEPGRRERNRRQRKQGYLDAAMAISSRDGIRNLTMSRLAEEVDAAVGTVYTYFPSKGALIAELQREALERLLISYRLLCERSEAELDAWKDPEAAAVARLAVFGLFWVASVDSLPQETRFVHALLTESEAMAPPEEQHRVVPAANRLLDEARSAVVAASEVGVISVGEPMDLVIRWAAALIGTLLTSNLAGINPVAFDGKRLTRLLQRDLLLGWGAPADLVDRAEAHVAGLEATGSMAPLPPSAG